VGKAGQIPCQQGKIASPPGHPIDNNIFLSMNENRRREFFWASQGNESAYQGIPQGKSVSMNIAKNSDSTDVICY
jgi:hypothetical protein